MTKYETVIGLEIHASVLTNSKVFSPSKNSFCEIPNSNVNEIDLSFPGILPSLNKEAVRKALKMSMVLGCNQPDELLFDRKNYYYPDLPKGYQITHVTKPIGINGKVDLFVDGQDFTVNIDNIHLEEDTASMDHYDYYSLIDYNRAGTPLIEIVTEPCISSGEEATAFLEFLANSLKYCGVSDADMKKGHMRCDLNINLKNENGEYITPKVEIKGIGSIANVTEAVNYEVARQIKALETGCEELVQETRRFDEDTRSTIRMRVKVDSVDYKYFVEPNIPRIKINDSWLDEIRKEIPVLPNDRLRKYVKEYSFTENEAKSIVKDYDLSNYYEECVNIGINPRTAFNWLSTNIIGYLNKEFISINEFFVGQVMKETKGEANPVLIKQILTEKLK